MALSKLDYAKLPEGYEGGTAAEKQAILWDNIRKTAYPSDCRPDAGFGFLGRSIIGLIVGGLNKTWMHSSDEMPEGRLKFLRPFGTTATVELETTGGDFTGVLKAGQKVSGVIRFTNIGEEAKSGFVPGIAVKFLVDGKPSVNTVGMYSMLPQKVEGKVDRNFFRYPLRNWFPSVSEQSKLDGGGFSLKTEITQRIFESSFGNKPNRMAVNVLGSVEASGREVPAAEQKTPRNLAFKPTRELTATYQAALDRDPNADYRDVLRTIEPGTVLFDVVAHDSDDERGYGTKVGTLKATSEILPSAWSDYRLFFRHDPTGSKDMR